MTETYGSIQAPSLRLKVSSSNPGLIDGRVEVDLRNEGILAWTLYDRHNGDVLFQSSDYTVSPDGSTATFSHTFLPHNDSGDTYTIKQDVHIAVS